MLCAPQIEKTSRASGESTGALSGGAPAQNRGDANYADEEPF